MKQVLLGSVILTFFAISITLFQLSCSKSSEAQTQTSNCIGTQPKMQFKWNNNLSNCDAVFDAKLGWKTSPTINGKNNNFTLMSWEGYGYLSTSVASLNLYFPNGQQPVVGSYTVTNGFCDCFINNTQYSKGTYTIVITSVANGYANGTFYGSVSTTSGSSTVTLTEGVFTNIPIVQ